MAVSGKIKHSAQECLTVKGEKVKSYAEKRVADFLTESKIKYDYEKSIILDGKTYLPDFYLRQFGIFVEYWGLVNFKRYKQRMNFKKKIYRKNGLKVISLYPDDLSTLHSSFFIQLKSLVNQC